MRTNQKKIPEIENNKTEIKNAFDQVKTITRDRSKELAIFYYMIPVLLVKWYSVI